MRPAAVPPSTMTRQEQCPHRRRGASEWQWRAPPHSPKATAVRLSTGTKRPRGWPTAHTPLLQVPPTRRRQPWWGACCARTLVCAWRGPAHQAQRRTLAEPALHGKQRVGGEATRRLGSRSWQGESLFQAQGCCVAVQTRALCEFVQLRQQHWVVFIVLHCFHHFLATHTHTSWADGGRSVGMALPKAIPCVHACSVL